MEILAACFGGAGEQANARGRRRDASRASPPELASLSFHLSLIDYAYDVATAGAATATAPDQRVAIAEQFDLPWDPKKCIAMLWVSRDDPGVGFLAFRGTMNLFEWTIDMRYAHTAYPKFGDGCFVHSGFHGAYESIRDDIHRAIAKHNILRIFISGHSLGGAMAVLAAADLGAVAVAEVVTFGAPRVGNVAWAHVFKQRTEGVRVLQVRDEGDAVCLVPLPSMADLNPFNYDPEYTHVGEWVYFRSGERSLAGCHSVANYRAFGDGVI